MKLPNIFKKKEKIVREKAHEIPAQKAAQVQNIRKIQPGGIAPRTLSIPHITEKASILGQENQYVFRVHSDSSKQAVRQAVQEAFGVDVESVRIIAIHPKKRRRGATIGTKSGYKKAIVRIKAGQKIELLPR